MSSKEYDSAMELLSNKQVFSEAGRAINYYSNYLIVAPYGKMPGWLIKAPLVLSGLENNVCTWYYVSKDGTEFDAALDTELKNKVLVRIAKRISRMRKSIVKKLRATDYASLSNQKLCALAKEYYDTYGNFVQLPAACRVVDRGIRRVLNEKILLTLSVTKDFSFITKETLALLKLAQKVKSGKVSKKTIGLALEKIMKKYCFVTCGYFNEPARTFSEYEKMLAEMVLGNPKAKYVQIVSQLNVDLAKRKELVRTLGPREKKIADIASEVTLLKDYSKESYNEIIYNSEKMFEEIAKRTKKTPFFIKQLDPSETIDLLCNKKEFGDEVLKRAKNSIIFNNTFGISVILGEEVDLLQKQFLSHNKVTEFRGRVASKGFVTGSARVVLTNDDFKKVKKGDILVVQNTNPGYVPLMNVAGGIVAEDGGITAHVSVTSREMGVPCVVGIVGVTKLIKDGDLIEVDAVKGIVKKISKS